MALVVSSGGSVVNVQLLRFILFGMQLLERWQRKIRSER